MHDDESNFNPNLEDARHYVFPNHEFVNILVVWYCAEFR